MTLSMYMVARATAIIGRSRGQAVALRPDLIFEDPLLEGAGKKPFGMVNLLGCATGGFAP
jgi:hypothetical protein